MIFIADREYSVIFIPDCLQTQKMHATVQYHFGSVSGMVEKVTNLETPNMYCLGNFQVVCISIAKYHAVDIY